MRRPLARTFRATIVLGMLACGDGATGDRAGGPAAEHPAPAEHPAAAESPGRELQLVGSVITPDNRPETGWLGYIQELDFDSSSGHVLALQPNRGNVVEFRPGGRLVVTYGGRRGQGPGEVARVVDFAAARHAVALLDRGNTRVLVYDRSGGLSSEFRVAAHHRTISFLGDDIVLAPGSHGAALDVYSSTGTRIDSLGRDADLPVRCEGADCATAALQCRGCDLAVSGSRILVVNRDQTIITVFDQNGDVLWRRDFLKDDPLVSAWAGADAPLLARMREEEAQKGPGNRRTEVLKSYFLHAQASSNGRILLSVVPSAAEFREAGYQLWTMDAASGSYERYAYPRSDVGFLAAGGDTRLFALNPATGEIVQLAFP